MEGVYKGVFRGVELIHDVRNSASVQFRGELTCAHFLGFFLSKDMQFTPL
jgi:hypothetical protein